MRLLVFQVWIIPINVRGAQEMVPGAAFGTSKSLAEQASYSDAKRPCSTCLRSHSYALAHVQQGSHLPPNPECTFDDGTFIHPLA